MEGAIESEALSHAYNSAALSHANNSAALNHADNSAALSHAAVRCFFENRLTEWAQESSLVAAKQYNDSLTSRPMQDAGPDDRTEGRRQGNDVSLAAQWMLRQKEGGIADRGKLKTFGAGQETEHLNWILF